MAIKSKAQLINYQSSYFFQQQKARRRTRILKTLLLSFCIVSFCTSLFLIVVQANPYQLNQHQKLPRDVSAESARFVFKPSRESSGSKSDLSDDFQTIQTMSPIDILPVSTDVTIDVKSMVAHTTVKQVFTNPYSYAVDGTYQFPLPENASVNFLNLAIGERVIEGEVMEKQQAKKVFLKAKKQGRKASLVTQQRPNLFTNQVANIAPNEQIVVTIKYVQTITYESGQFVLRFPLAITPRYQPPGYTDPHFGKVSIAPNNSVLTQANVSISVDAGVPISRVISPSHTIAVMTGDESKNHFTVGIDPNAAATDRAFVLYWQPQQSHHSHASVFEQMIDGEYFGLVTVIPPTQASGRGLARDVTFIIDTSGSMQGRSIAQAKQSLMFALSTLTTQDSFNIIAFESTSRLLFQQTRMATVDNVNQARRFIHALSADGGTQMYQPLSQALMMPTTESQQAHALKQIIFITDGAVGNEHELLQLLNRNGEQHRVFTVGIGGAPNGYFMKKAAQFGRGSYTYINNLNEVNLQMTKLLDKISRPVLRNINMAADQSIGYQLEVYPKPEYLGDLYGQTPVVFSYRSPIPLNAINVSGVNGDNQEWRQEVLVKNNESSNLAMSSLWARAKIESLLDELVKGKAEHQIKPEVLATSMTHQVISPYSSFIAVEKTLMPEPSELERAKTANKKQALVALATPQTGLAWHLQLFIGVILMMGFGVAYWLKTRQLKAYHLKVNSHVD